MALSVEEIISTKLKEIMKASGKCGEDFRDSSPNRGLNVFFESLWRFLKLAQFCSIKCTLWSKYCNSNISN